MMILVGVCNASIRLKVHELKHLSFLYDKKTFKLLFFFQLFEMCRTFIQSDLSAVQFLPLPICNPEPTGQPSLPPPSHDLHSF
jgi:hypothetical protein